MERIKSKDKYKLPTGPMFLDHKELHTTLLCDQDSLRNSLQGTSSFAPFTVSSEVYSPGSDVSLEKTVDERHFREGLSRRHVRKG